MIVVKIDAEYTTQVDIQRCIEAFLELKGEQAPNLIVKFTERIKEIDILLIGYLILFKEIKPDLKIKIVLKSNEVPKSEDEKGLKYKLFHYLIYAFLMTGKNVFEIEFSKVENRPKFWIDEKTPDSIFQRYFTVSNSFLPIILINNRANNENKKLYEILFESKIDDEIRLKSLPDYLEFNINSHDLFIIISRWIKGKWKGNNQKPGILNIENRFECIQYLSILAFYKSLDRAKILSMYFCDPLERKRIKISGLSYSKAKSYPHIKYFNSVKKIFDDLSTKPPVYHFVFAMLISSDIINEILDECDGYLRDENVDNFHVTLESLWQFTKDLVHGIKELAKNIHEHPTPPIGFITGKIYKENIWAELKMSYPKSLGIFNEYVKTLSTGNHSFLDINVVDLGEKGILETLKDGTNNLYNKDLKKEIKALIAEDVKAFEDDDISLSHLIDPTIGSILNQQTKRATAHLGLLIFSNLILENQGLVRLGTGNKKDNKDHFNEAIISHENLSGQINTVGLGTNYHIVLPIPKKGRLLPRSLQPYSLPLDSIPIEIEGIESLLNYNVMSPTNDLKETKKNLINDGSTRNKINTIYHLKLNNIYKKEILYNRNDEFNLWHDSNIMINKIQSEFDETKFNVVCIDFEDLKINSSQLFRFLGKWELFHTKKNLLILNIETSVYKELIFINENFRESLSNLIDYWNENTIVIFYTYVNINSKNRFYFTDGLWGRTESDFLDLNLLISKTNFNATLTIKLVDSESHPKRNDYNHLSIIAQSGLFHTKTTLLPFDLLLIGYDDLTIFASNASVILQNQMSDRK